AARAAAADRTRARRRPPVPLRRRSRRAHHVSTQWPSGLGVHAAQDGAARRGGRRDGPRSGDLVGWQSDLRARRARAARGNPARRVVRSRRASLIRSPVPMKKQWSIAAAASLGLALLTLNVPSRLFDPPAAANGVCDANAKAAPLNFTLKDIQNKDVKLADYKGKVLVIDFWATWCGPCKLEIPGFVDL